MAETVHSDAGSVPESPLRMHGRGWGGLVPLIVLIGILVWLSIAADPGADTFWVAAWIALIVGLFFAADKRRYAETIVKGIGDRTGIVMVTAWIFAGVFGQLMVAGNLVDGLLWAGLNTGMTGNVFTILTFVAAIVFGVGAGTGNGTVIALTPVLYPAGVLLGAEPIMLAVAIIAGGCVGDNWSPVSDTTIVSAFTQGAEVRDVVRSRLPLSIAAVAIALAVFALTGWVTGGGDTRPVEGYETGLNPVGLVMLVPFAVVLTAALMRRHLIEALAWGSVSAILIGVGSGTMAPGAVLHVPSEESSSTGAVQDGISSVVGAIIFALLVLAIAQVLMDSGLMGRMLRSWQGRFVRSVRTGELSIFGWTIAFSTPIAANVPAEILVGSSVAKPLGESVGLSPERRANLLDCGVCSLYYMLPWHGIVVLWYGMLQEAAAGQNLPVPPIYAAFFNPYAWGVILVVLVSISTGWNRGVTQDSDAKQSPTEEPDCVP